MAFPGIRAALLALVAVAIPTAAGAQRADTVLDRALSQNWFLRVHTRDQSTAGRVRVLRSDSVNIGTTRIRRDEITMVERRMSTGGGWRAGAAVGALGVGLLGYGVSGLCESDCTDDHILGALGGAALGATIGLFFGEAVAPQKHKWQKL